MNFTQEHQWLRKEADGTITIGITDYAQEELGDIVFIEMPDIDAHVDDGDELVNIESVKAMGEVRAPFGVTVVAVNTDLIEGGDDTGSMAAQPELVNSEPLDGGWLVRIQPDEAVEWSDFMDEDGYAAYIEGL